MEFQSIDNDSKSCASNEDTGLPISSLNNFSISEGPKRQRRATFPPDLFTFADNTSKASTDRIWEEKENHSHIPNDKKADPDPFPLAHIPDIDISYSLQNNYSPTFANLLICPPPPIPSFLVQEYDSALETSQIPHDTIFFQKEEEQLDSDPVIDMRKKNSQCAKNLRHPLNPKPADVKTCGEVIESERKQHTSDGYCGKKRCSDNRPASRTNEFTFVQKPTEFDVLFGRGGGTNHHKGNQRYLMELEKVKPVYRKKTKLEKTSVSQDFVDHVHQYGGRFLKKDSKANMWYEVSNEEARKKVSQALREDNVPRKKAAKRKICNKKGKGRNKTKQRNEL